MDTETGGRKNGVVCCERALTSYAVMMKHRYKYFRWTKRTAWLTFTYVVAVPAFVGYWGYQFEVRWSRDS